VPGGFAKQAGEEGFGDVHVYDHAQQPRASASGRPLQKESLLFVTS
jgi:hypothetical protein